MRDQLILERAGAIQKELEAWAAENAILQPGERLVFSLRIEPFSTVVRDATQDPLGLSVANFFTAPRFREAGVPKEHGTRIITTVIGEACYIFDEREGKGQGALKATLREFLEARPDRPHMLRIPNFGPTCLRGFVRVLEAAGIPDAERYVK